MGELNIWLLKRNVSTPFMKPNLCQKPVFLLSSFLDEMRNLKGTACDRVIDRGMQWGRQGFCCQL